MVTKTMRGQCLFDEERYCDNRDCRGCQTCLDAIGKANEELCPVCGADIKVWREVFGEDHYCDPEWEKS